MLADINGNLADLRSEVAMASQRFCLRWNNHQHNMLSVFDQLLADESFVDVTIAVDGHFLKAHKMVLSACSPYFQALFVSHPDKHPIVIMKDVPYVDMKSLLDFMYRGEVSVEQDRLTAFLRVAETLRVKGLTETADDKEDHPSIIASPLHNQNAGPPPPPPNLHRINQFGHHQMAQKRFHHQVSTHPLLGSALTAPKRKRGRPRKLSGSSDTPMDTSLGHDQSGVDLVQGSPEMMEMKMGLDFQSETTGQNSSTGSAGSNDNERHSKSNMEVTENGTDQTDASLLLRIKGEPDPTPSTSAQAKDDEFTRPQSRQGSEIYKQGSLVCLPSDTTFEICCTDSDLANELAASDDDDNDSTSASDPFDQYHQLHHHHSSVINHTDFNVGTKKSSSSEEGVHFISDDRLGGPPTITLEDNPELTEPEVRKQLLEYLVQKDGSVVCKWCGEVLPSRSRWYRHKYKLHVTSQNQPQAAQHQVQPAPLFKCQSCNAYFKSRKGYIGHLSSRHPGDDAGSGVQENDENREDTNAPRTNATKTTLPRKITDIANWEQQREKEEKLVAEIIDRVKRECEAQGETVTRRGYSRRTTVMNS